MADAPVHLLAAPDPDRFIDEIATHAATTDGLIVIDVQPDRRPAVADLADLAHEHRVAIVVTDPALPEVDHRAHPLPRLCDLVTPTLADHCDVLVSLHRDEKTASRGTSLHPHSAPFLYVSGW